MRPTPDLRQDQTGGLRAVVKSLQGEGAGGVNAALVYGPAAGAASGAAQKKNASRATERHYEMDIPTHRPRLPGGIIPVKSSADHRPVTDAGRARVEQFRTARFPFPIQILHWNGKHLERGAFSRATEWRQWIHRCRTAQGNTEGQ